MTRLTTDLHPDLRQDVLDALFKKSIFTTLCFVQKNSNLLSNITGLPYDKILKIKDVILLKYSSPLKRGDKYYLDTIKHCAIIPSGIKQLDSILDGGFMTGNIYEVCGLEGSGKTQLCMSVALNICLNSPHQVLFMDTKYDISVQRLVQMLSAQNVFNKSKVLEKIKICHPTSACKLLNDLHHLTTSLSQSSERYLGFKLIIIDSLSILFQSFYNFAEGNTVLNKIANIMKMLVVEYHLAILITNFVTSWTSEMSSGDSEIEMPVNFSRVEMPALGKYWAYVPNVRIMSRKRGCSDECYLTILKSQCQPTGKTVKIEICDAGIT
ncbi:hypothetical protein RUM43_006914 [Polyplax serrata]|uniref:RecA family profile 1 domain-containing protein n=1 Tax=Polyplax serrata TaxID=468196 RepID=A0AAN8PWC4_POLSC